MKNWKHLTFEQRKTISSGISHEYKLKDIGESLLVDPTSVSKEVKRNRTEVSIGLKNNCKRTQRWPYVCTGCKNRYNNCPYTKYKYDASKAQEKADINLINSRRGIDVDDEEFKKLLKMVLMIINLSIKLKLKIIILLRNVSLLYMDILTKVI